LRGGAHVLADKPLCTSLEQLEAIRETAAETGRHVSIVFEKRFYPATLALRRLIADGVLGPIAMVASTGPHKLNQPTRPAWFLDPATYGGIAGDLPIHDIDLVLDLAGEQQGARPTGTVSAHVGNARAEDHPGFDDHVALLMRAGQVPATIEANWLGPEAADVHGHYRMRVTGSLGTAEVDWAYHRLTVTTHRRETWDEPRERAQRPAQYFVDAVLAGQEPVITTPAGRLATAVPVQAARSAEATGAPEQAARGRATQVAPRPQRGAAAGGALRRFWMGPVDRNTRARRPVAGTTGTAGPSASCPGPVCGRMFAMLLPGGDGRAIPADGRTHHAQGHDLLDRQHRGGLPLDGL